MATVTQAPMSAPSSQELHQALTSYVTTVAGVGHVRSKEYGPYRFAFLSEELEQSFRKEFTMQDASKLIEDFDEQSKPALAAIYEEMVYITKRYEWCGRELNHEMIIPELADEYDNEEGDPFSAVAVKEIDVVKGSVGFILDKLPKWARRILEALMEALKISRGAI